MNAPVTPMISPADLLEKTAAALAAADALLAVARERLAAKGKGDGRVSGTLVEQHQYGVHGFAWLATYVEALRQMQDWAQRLSSEGALGETERLILQIAFGEYLWQLYGGIPMNQGEIVRPQDMGLSQDDQRVLMTPAVQWLTQHGNSDAARLRLAELMAQQEGVASFGATGLEEEFEMVREQFRRFTDDRVLPDAHGWHLRDDLFLMEIVDEMSELGVFGLSIPE